MLAEPRQPLWLGGEDALLHPPEVGLTRERSHEGQRGGGPAQGCDCSRKARPGQPPPALR